VRTVHGDCDRARQWASIELDGELSTFEGVLLHAHLAGCASCREFHSGIGDFAAALRGAPDEQFEGVQLGRMRRRVSLRLAPAVAAMAVLAVGLGSISASSHLGFGSGTATPPAAASVDVSSQDAMNLHTLRTLERMDIVKSPTRTRRSGGGPFVQER
jgi:predicted anti-sigma-YlaC factor YlaD